MATNKEKKAATPKPEKVKKGKKGGVSTLEGDGLPKPPNTPIKPKPEG